MTEKLSINGLKLSEPLISIQVHALHRTFDHLSVFCRFLAQNRINIAFIASANVIDPQPVLCCIDPKEKPVVDRWLEQHDDLKGIVRFGGIVGVITFYPHHSSLNLMGLALQVLSRNEVGVHGLASSIAAFSFVVDLAQLEKAGRILAEYFQLPANASPMRADFRVRQERRSI